MAISFITFDVWNACPALLWKIFSFAGMQEADAGWDLQWEVYNVREGEGARDPRPLPAAGPSPVQLLPVPRFAWRDKESAVVVRQLSLLVYNSR